MSEFRFDPLSFLIGFGSASGIALVLYRLRHRLGRMRQQAQDRAESARRFATRTADVRYQIDVRNYAESYHAANRLAQLSEILIEPRFIIGMTPYDTTGEHKMQNVFHVIPMIHRFPDAYARFNIKTIGVQDLGASNRHLALLGLPGSGRSTALAAIALWALGTIEFDQVEDVVQRAIEEEEEALDEKERAVRRKEREDIQTRALEQIAHAQEEASAAASEDEEQPQREIVDFRRLMPILVHFSDIVVDPEFDGRIDPAEPLVQAVQQNLRRVSALTVPRYVYNRLNSGQALVLLDGLDDLPQEQQDVRLAWLRQFMDTYPQCTIIASGPATGYYPLSQLGLTPMFLRPWMPRDIQRYTEKWANIWPQAAGTRRQPAAQPHDTTVTSIVRQARGKRPMDTLVHILSAFTHDEDEAANLTLWDWYSDFATQQFSLREFEKNEDVADSALYAVAELAARMLEEGPLTLEAIRSDLAERLTISEDTEQKSKERYLVDIEQLVKMLLNDSGLLVKRFGNRYEFANPLIGAFLASATLLTSDAGRAIEDLLEAPQWRTALSFAVTQAPMDMVNRAVVNSLTRQPDLLFQNLLTLSDWMPYTPQDAPWRGEVFKRLAAALIAPSQFPTLREWAMAALVATHDPNARVILRQAIRSTDTHIRTLGCIGLGAYGDSEGIRDLRSMLEDEAMEVQLAAGLALGAIGTERAVEVMLEGLTQGEENLRQAVAEALAALPEYGHLTLHEAATHDDMMIRRASVFGLARIGTPWALTDLYRRLLEDDQWYVRSAAEQVFATARPEVKETALAHPPLDEVEWLTEWLQEHNITLEPDQDLEQILVRMLRDGEQPYRIAAAHTLGRLGYLPALNALYVIMADESDAVRTASFAALAELETQYALPLPAVL